MSINLSGLDRKLQSTVVPMNVSSDHQLTQLANALPLTERSDRVVVDLKNTTAGGFW